jgi:hypothetical protein
MFLANLDKIFINTCHFEVEDEFEDFSFEVKSAIDVGQGYWIAFCELHGDLKKVGYGVIEGYRDKEYDSYAFHDYKDAKKYFLDEIGHSI